jgi:ornithine carbamoyltransferase
MVAGFELSLACPPGYLPDAAITREAGPAVHVFRDPRDAVAGAHAVYTDVWVSMGDEQERRARMTDLAAYRVDGGLMRLASHDAIFLHCLPAHRGEEVTEEALEGPRSRIFDEAENRLHAQKAVMALLLGEGGL